MLCLMMSWFVDMKYKLPGIPVHPDGGGHVAGAGHEGVGHRVEVGDGVGIHSGAVRLRELGQREEQKGAY